MQYKDYYFFKAPGLRICILRYLINFRNDAVSNVRMSKSDTIRVFNFLRKIAFDFPAQWTSSLLEQS